MSIQVKEVSKYYGQQAALQSVSLEIKKGEIVGFLGPNGAGKSTLMKIITTYLAADEGQVEVCQENVEENPLSIRQKVGYLAEHNPLYLEMYIKEYLNFIADLYGCSKQRVSDIIDLTGLSPEQHKKIGELSKGYRQRVGLAAALIHEPEVLILDEPTTGLDPNQLVEIRTLIKNSGKNKTVMLSTHIMQEVEKMCNRVIIINKGKIVADEQLESLKAKKIDLESYFQQLTA
jgi:ABC-2 type transport system ATP-binding protein